MKEILLTENNFNEEVIKSDVPVLVDFWASWCGPCMMMGPVVAELAEDMEGKAKVGKVNVDEQPGLANRFGINVIPTFIVFKNGQVADSIVGVRSKEDLMEALL